MSRRKSTFRRRGSAGVGASERQRLRQPIANLGKIAERADMPSTTAEISEALMERRASDPPRRAMVQIRVGSAHRLRQPVRLRTIEETAEILNVSSRTVRRLIDSGALPVHRFGRSVRVSDLDIAHLMAASRDD
jgi:excisionase family DNA binding protein